MSSRYLGGFVGNNFSTSRFGTNSGMFTLGQQLEAAGTGTWPGSGYDVILSFTGSGSFEVPVGVEEIAEYAIIAGGAGGGADAGGGGGAGGVRLGAGLPVIAGKVYPIAVGGGGSAGDHPVAPSQGGNGSPSAFETDANLLYFVAVGAAVSPGSGNRYYVKTFNEFSGATANVEGETLNLYEGSTYRFDQSHPTNSGHPFRFSSSEVSPASSATPYTTGVTTSQPGVGTGSIGSRVQIQVASPAPQLYYYCTSHPVSGSATMGGAAGTPANITVKSDGGGGGAAWEAPSARPGGCGGGNGAAASASSYMGNSFAITQVTAAGETTTSQGFAGGSAGGIAPHGLIDYAGAGGGGAGGHGGNVQSTPGQARAGNGGNGISISIIGTSTVYAGGGGGGDGPGATSPGGGKGGNAKFFGEFRGGAGDGAHDTVKHGGFAPDGSPALPSTGGGGGGGAITDDGGGGGSGLILIKFKNKVNNANKTIEFLASTSFKNDYGFKEAEYLIVGGGGSGGFGGGGEGGGGAGGVRIGTGLPLVDKEQIIIKVGSGGTAAGPADAATNGGKGGESSITSTSQNLHIGANGGGRAVSAFPQNFTNTAGGSGGGGRYAAKGQPGITLTTSNGHATNGSLSLFGISQSSPNPLQGHRGGDAVGTGSADRKGGGGGGAVTAGQAGADVTHPRGGNGGNAISSSITGFTRFYAGGGGGCSGTAAGPLGICSLGGGTGGPLSGAGPGSANSPVYANKGGGGDGYDLKPTVGSAPTNDGGVNTGGGGGAAQNGSTPGAHPAGVVSGAGGSGIVVLKITR